MLVGRLSGTSRDAVNIDVDGKVSEALEVLKARLLPGFPQRHGEDVGISIGMAAELKPKAPLGSSPR